MPQKTTQKRQRSDLNTSQTTALAAILAGQSITDTAKAANVDRSTVHRWLREEAQLSESEAASERRNRALFAF